jgi:hypothetical protein
MVNLTKLKPSKNAITVPAINMVNRSMKQNPPSFRTDGKPLISYDKALKGINDQTKIINHSLYGQGQKATRARQNPKNVRDVQQAVKSAVSSYKTRKYASKALRGK